MRLSLTHRLWGLRVPVKFPINRKGKVYVFVLSLAVLLIAAGITTGIPNPSAVYCVEQGYEYVGGNCIFPDGSSCSAWQYYCNCEPESGFCLPGGDYDCHWPCEELPCKQAGESVLVGHCCPGLSEIPPPYVYDEQCNFTGMTGWTYVCSDCGNGICEAWESRCNCAEDCVGGDLEVGEGETYTVTGGCEEYDECEIEGTVIVPAGTCLICNERSWIDGNGGDGEGGDEYAHLIVYGDVWINDRFDMGQDHDAYLSVLGGGTFTQRYNSDGLQLPDNEGGVHKIFLNDYSTLEAERIELIGYRDAEVHMGEGCTLTVHDLDDGIGDEREDPGEWLNDGYLLPIPPFQLTDISIEYINGGDDGAIVTVWGWPPPPCDPNKASHPDPPDGETGVKSAITEVVLEWMPSCAVMCCPMCRHFVYFGTDFDDVNDAPIYETGWVPGEPGVPPEYKGWLPAFEPYLPPFKPYYSVGNLPLWTTFYWRIDEGPQGPIVKGDVWGFTTGCPLIVGDLNLDCLLNLEDYAILLETWGQKQYFPWD